ncbi:growth arrest-specific protein 8-like isoform X2 [Centruroides sculpturatus]|uniref:growth arrest-specific protein 8-like isoform X2 n=1 Tax=Centruroides sculpturatus TaxID=218467 RepID=UPI000C6D03F7|nr:growth arrest-specific protein 8-like isoform X2 [Centruroides sculpturatus]
MPPKKKKGKKWGKEQKKLLTIDGIPLADMTREELIDHIIRLREELEREREERNFYQIERDQINTFWEITKQELEEKNSEILCKEIAFEEAENKHKMEINLYKEKTKCVLYENHKNLNAECANALKSLEKAKECHRQEESLLIEEKRNLETKLENEYLNHLKIVQYLQSHFTRKVSEVEESYNEKLKSGKIQQEQEISIAKKNLELQKKKEIEELEVQKNLFIDKLISNHDKEFTDLKTYYKDITVNNIALINMMKKQLEITTNNHKRIESQLNEKIKENQNLSETLKHIQEELKTAQIKVNHYDQINSDLEKKRHKIKKLEKEISEIMVQNEIYQQKCNQLQKERKKMYSNFLLFIQELQQKMNLKHLMLEKKVLTLKQVLENKSEQIIDLASNFKIGPDITPMLPKKIELVLKEKDSLIIDLEQEILKLCKSHSELASNYENKLKKLEV